MFTRPNHDNRKNNVPLAVRRLIRLTPGAQAQIARHAGCSRSMVCLVIGGQRRCNQRLWDAIVDWICSHEASALREMARTEIDLVELHPTGMRSIRNLRR